MQQPRFRSVHLLPCAGLTSATTDDAAALGEDFFVALDAGRGEISVQTEGSLEITLTADAAHPPSWCEFRWDGELEPSLPRVIVRLEAEAEDPVRLNPALRLMGEDGFSDVFSGQPVTIGPGRFVVEREIRPSPANLEGRDRMNLHLFIEPRSQTFALHTLMLTALR